MSQIKPEESPMCIHCLKPVWLCGCELDGLPGLLRSECRKAKPTRAKKNNSLVDEIITELQKILDDKKIKHDKSGWPHKFLYAHEGIGIMKAIEVVRKTEKKFISKTT